MAIDRREEVLKRLLVIAAAVEGVKAAARNRSDVAGLARPAILIQDGAEDFASAPRGEQLSRVQMMELHPQIWIKVKVSDEESGPLLSRLRNRLIKAIAEDAELPNLLTSNGFIRFDGSSRPAPTPEGEEQRMDVDITFGYPLLLHEVL